MICDTCERRMNYCFYINDELWMKAVGKKEGYKCAHCILEKLGGLDWMIIWNEPTERIRTNMEDTKDDGYTKRERGHVNYCQLASDHEGDCRALSDDVDQHGRRIPFEDPVEPTRAETGQ